MFKTKSLGIGLIAMLAAVLAIGAVGSGAWFTDQATTPVTATSGQIVFDVNGADSAGITLTNLMPGVWSSAYEVNAYNTSQSTGDVKYRIRSEWTTGNSSLFDKLQVIVRHTYCGTADPASWPIVEQGALGNLAVTSPDDAISDTLGVNITHCFYFQFRLASNADNSYQSLGTGFNLVFDATQPENPGWAQ